MHILSSHPLSTGDFSPRSSSASEFKPPASFLLGPHVAVCRGGGGLSKLPEAPWTCDTEMDVVVSGCERGSVWASQLRWSRSKLWMQFDPESEIQSVFQSAGFTAARGSGCSLCSADVQPRKQRWTECSPVTWTPEINLCALHVEDTRARAADPRSRNEIYTQSPDCFIRI